MSLVVLEKEFSQEEKMLIELCKSCSQVSGYKLREAHYSLGEAAVKALIKSHGFSGKNFSILIMMRAGLNFALGISDMLEKMNKSIEIHLLNNELITDKVLDSIKGKQVVVVDAVINSGKSIFKVLEQLPSSERKSCLVFTTVMPSSSTILLNSMNIFTVRTSANKYKGAKVTKIQGGIGPDTGDRLFGTL